MKIKPGFNLRQVCGENIIVAEGEENINFSSIISVNETAAFVWKAMEDKDFDVKDMAEALMAEYEVDEATALNDSEELAKEWKNAGIISA